RRSIRALKRVVASVSTTVSGVLYRRAVETPSTSASNRRASCSALSLCERKRAVARRRASPMVAMAMSVGAEGGQLFGLVLGKQRVDDGIELAGHDVVELVQRQIDAMIGDSALRKVIGANALRPVATADQFAA